MFLTESQIIITPVLPSSLRANADRYRTAGQSHRIRQTARQGFFGSHDTTVLQRLDELAEEYSGSDPVKVFVAEPGAHMISLDTIQEIVITWVRSSSWLLFPLGMFPAEPGNARYRVNYQLSVVTGKTKTYVITPFSPELKQALKDLVGEKVHEVPDACAPIL